MLPFACVAPELTPSIGPLSDVFQPGKFIRSLSHVLITDNVSKNSSRRASVQCTIKIVVLKKKIIFREDRTVEDGHEVQQQ